MCLCRLLLLGICRVDDIVAEASDDHGSGLDDSLEEEEPGKTNAAEAFKSLVF